MRTWELIKQSLNVNPPAMWGKVYPFTTVARSLPTPRNELQAMTFAAPLLYSARSIHPGNHEHDVTL